tara:strand:+ start:627 stop:902 length:276 start_codon:yes stop_codon:yes gene_type:complete
LRVDRNKRLSKKYEYYVSPKAILRDIFCYCTCPFFITTACISKKTNQLIDQLNHGSLSIQMDAANNFEKLSLIAIPAIQKALPKATGQATC